MADTVLVIEDESDVVDLLRYNLNKAGFSVLIAYDGLAGLEMARKSRPEIVVLDLMLPKMDGYSVCKALKRDADTELLPIVMLTARGEMSERVRGLEIGADDYVTKPFSPRELVLRIQSVLRRSRSKVPGEVIGVGDFHLDKNKFDVRLEGRRLDGEEWDHLQRQHPDRGSVHHPALPAGQRPCRQLETAVVSGLADRQHRGAVRGRPHRRGQGLARRGSPQQGARYRRGRAPARRSGAGAAFLADLEKRAVVQIGRAHV